MVNLRLLKHLSTFAIVILCYVENTKQCILFALYLLDIACNKTQHKLLRSDYIMRVGSVYIYIRTLYIIRLQTIAHFSQHIVRFLSSKTLTLTSALQC